MSMPCPPDRARPGDRCAGARLLLGACLALLLPSCGGPSATAPSVAAAPLLQGLYLLSVRPAPLCSDFPVSTLEVEVQASTAAGRVELEGANASGSLQQSAAASGVAGLLEVFASEVPVPRGVADTARASFYVFAQASGGLTQSVAGRNEVRSGELTGSLTLYRAHEGVNRTDRCSVPGHSFSLVAR
jgi:hypothetical protein